jgi:hypothetical protein
MKKHLLLFIIWSLLLVMRFADLASAAVQFREVQDRERLLLSGPFQLEMPERDVKERLREEKKGHLDEIIVSCVEVTLVVILGVCCIRLVKQSAKAGSVDPHACIPKTEAVTGGKGTNR